MASTYTHTIGSTYKTDAGTIASPVASYTAAGQTGFQGTIAHSTTNQEIDIEFLVAKIYSILIYSSAALTVKTNSTSAPDNTVTLAAGQAVIWAHDYSASNPITANVTKIYVTNASSTAAATLKIEVLLNL